MTSHLDLKIILLVRDPRAVTASRLAIYTAEQYREKWNIIQLERIFKLKLLYRLGRQQYTV